MEEKIIRRGDLFYYDFGIISVLYNTENARYWCCKRMIITAIHQQLLLPL